MCAARILVVTVMAEYAIGDLQGNFNELQALLERIDFLPGRDRIWFTGDLVNRGPASLECLRFVRGLGDSALVVMGNHDFHLLCVSQGATHARKGDTMEAILAAPDREELLGWVRSLPLLVSEKGFVMVHAGVLPQWTIDEAAILADEVAHALRTMELGRFCAELYGDEDRWSDELVGMERVRVVVNAMTRMRVCSPDGRMQLRFKGEPGAAPAGFLPWFAVPGRKSRGTPLICGHWSALGLQLRDDLIAVDTGCLWGRSLTAVRLHDRTVFQVPGPAFTAHAGTPLRD